MQARVKPGRRCEVHVAIDPAWSGRNFGRYVLNSRMPNFQSGEDRWMNGYVAGDPVVQRLRTLEEFGQGFSRSENRRSHECQNKSRSLIGRGCMVSDPRV
jgi:hypothetical protein